jgi:taurine--2-oxoglutarate transaminase
VTIAPATANLARGEAAKRIVELAPEGFSKVFFTNAGADANENAIRMARLYTGRDKVLSAYRSYHGNTGSAIAATGDWRRVPNEYSRGHVHFFNPYLYRSEFNATTEEEECQRALAHLRRIIECEGPTPSPRFCWSRFPVPPAFWCRRTAICRACGRWPTSLALC